MNILLVVDDFRSSGAVIDAVLALRPARETVVKVLEVIEPPALLVGREMGGYDPALETALQAEREDAEASVQKVAGVLRWHGFEVIVATEYGKAKAKILEVAEKWPADLIVLDAHEHGGLESLLSRSVVQSVAKHAFCSVELVRPPAVRSVSGTHDEQFKAAGAE